MRKLVTNRPSNLWALLLAFVAVTTLAGCHDDNPPLYSHFEHVDPQGWHRVVALEFLDDSIPKADTRVNAEIALRLTQDYPFQELWLEVRRYNFSELEACDTLKVQVADENGRQLGNGGKPLRNFTAPLPSPFTLKPGWHMDVSHLMKEQSIPGINDIGLNIYYSEP